MIYHDLPIKNADFRGFDVVKPLVFDVCFFFYALNMLLKMHIFAVF